MPNRSKFAAGAAPRIRGRGRGSAAYEMVMAISNGWQGRCAVVRRLGGEPCTRRTWRHLAGTQGDDPPPGMVDLDHHLLAARQQIVFGEGVPMRDLVQLVAAGDGVRSWARQCRLGLRNTSSDPWGVSESRG